MTNALHTWTRAFALTLLAVLLVLPPATRGAPLQLDTPPTAITPTAEVGTLAGSFAVNDAGSASYSIPLELPPGTGGMTPSLALAYDSAAGKGPLGVGWALAGASSSIERCATSLAIEGEIRPIAFTDADALCLDGERLVLLDGAPWQAGAVYGRRRDDLSRVHVVPRRACASRFAFELRSADGRVHEYGCSDDALVRTPRGILRWSLDRSADRFGNFIAYTYDFDDVDVWSAKGEFEGLARVDHRLARIDYGGHAGEPALAPDRSVVLDWEDRPDSAQGWAVGAPTSATKRLREVAAFHELALVRRWPLTYEQGAATQRSRLIAVRECAADGACKPATTFDWIEGEPDVDDAPFGEWSLDGATFPQGELYGSEDPIFAQVSLDANGDGMTDLLAAVGELFDHTGNWELWRSQPNTSAPGGHACLDPDPDACATTYQVDQREREHLLSFAIDFQPQQVSFALDLDGDGFDDLAAPSPEGLAWNVDPWLNWAISHVVLVRGSASGDVLESDIQIAANDSPAWTYAATDLTGDGLGDLVYCRATPDEIDDRIGTWRLLVNQPWIGLDPANAIDTGMRCSVYDKLLLLDHDGDDVTELLVIPTWDDDAHANIPSSKWSSYQALAFTPALDAFAWVDTGLPPDLAQRWRPASNQGLVGKDFPAYGPLFGRDVVVDVQGDGLPDLLRYQLTVGDTAEQLPAIVEQLFSDDYFAEQGGLRLWINTGDGFRDGGWVTVGEPGGALAEAFVGAATLDWDADGRLDLLMGDIDDERWHVWRSTGEGFVEQDWPESPAWESAGPLHPHALAAMDVDGDGLHDPVVWQWTEGQFWDVRRHRGEPPDRIRTIVDGLGQRTEIDYASITDYEHADLYEHESCSLPAACAARPQIVVARHRIDAGLVAGMREYVHRYAGTRSDRLERRWLGFAEHTVTQWHWNGAGKLPIGEQTTWFANAKHDDALVAYPFAGLPVARIEQLRDPDTGERFVALDQHSYEVIPTGPHGFRVVESSSRSRTWEPASCFGEFCSIDEVTPLDPLKEASTIVYDFDELGFALHERTSVNLGPALDSVDVQREVVHDFDAWLIGRVTHETALHLLDEPVARTRAFTYAATTGALVTEVDEPDAPELRLTTGYQHDPFGNITAMSLADAFGEVRTTTVEFDERGHFPIAIVNALGHVTRLAWHDELARPHTVIDPNAVRQVIDVDGFGRTTGVREFAGDLTRGDDLTIEYLPAAQGMQIRATTLGHGQHTTTFDRLARPTVERWRGPEGLEREARTDYDLLGRVAAVTLPRFVGDPIAGFDAWTYDVRGRPLLHTRADGAFERWFYTGLTVEHRDFVGERTIQHHDGAGRVIESERAPELSDHERLCFDYGAFSTLAAVRPDCIAPDLESLAAPGEAPTTIKRFEYDRLGRVLVSHDPSEGERLYQWNAFDELVETFDANERLVEWQHDLLGRTTARIDDAGETTWTWDLGKLGTIDHAVTPTGTITSHAFDAFVRPIALTQQIEGESFTVRLDYDARDRVAAIHYPQVQNLPAFAVRNLYGEDGSVVGVRELASNQPIWQLDEVDADGRIVRESFRNGLTTTRSYDAETGDLLGIHTSGGPALVQDLGYAWSDAGQLLQREDRRVGQSEAFGYDALHRLTLAHAERGAKQHERHFAYDTLGNLVHATDVGDYEYDARGRLMLAGSTAHEWDAVGNVVHRVAPEGEHRFAWTSFDKLATLIPADAEPTLFEYDADQHRVRRHDLEAERATVYAFGFYERDASSEGELHRHYVYGSDRVVAEFEVEISPDAIVSERTRYVHDDHLGSIDVVTDEQGEVVQRLAHDAWGKPRDPNDWTLPEEFTAESLVNRGYTGHEGRRDAGLINMNGRLYDPRLGRMVNADPFVPAPEFTIGWNRYAYVFDDPLSLTDPSGFSPEDEPKPKVEKKETQTTDENGNVTRVVDTTVDGVHTSTEVIAQRPDGGGGGEASGGGGEGDAGPAADARGEETGDQTSRDIALGVGDGVGNTGYVMLSGAAFMVAGPIAAGVSAVGFWGSGGNPAGAARRAFGRLIGSETLSADPSSGAYVASMIVGEIVSGGVGGVAARSGARAAASVAAGSCARSCGRFGTGLGGRLIDMVARSSCFVAGTPITMADGMTLPIEQVREGDRVACYDDEGLATCEVGPIVQRRASVVLDLEIATDEGERRLTVTPEHPFFVVEFGLWVDANNLAPGDTLLTAAGGEARVLGATRREGEFEVFNFESLVAHDYFAGDVLVHNGCSKLARAMEAATGVARPLNHAAHHIVALRAKGAAPAQTLLKKLGISLDEAANGVYLPQNAAGRVANPAARYHPSLHTEKYYDAVNFRLAKAAAGRGSKEVKRARVVTEMQAIGIELATGSFRP